MRRSVIYFAKSSNGLTKVGHSRNVEQRLIVLQRQLNERLSLVATFPVSTFDLCQFEFGAHVFLKPYHVYGEWFDLREQQILDALEYLKSYEPSKRDRSNKSPCKTNP